MDYKKVKLTDRHEQFLPHKLLVNKYYVLIFKRNLYIKWLAFSVILLIAGAAVILSYTSLIMSHTSIPKDSIYTGTKKGKTSGMDTNAFTPTSTSQSSSGSSKNSSNTSSGVSYKNTSATLPSSIINLANWKLTLPIVDPSTGGAYEITQPQLASYINPPYFQADSSGNGIQFEAPVGGVTTDHSNFPRSELREMTDNGNQNASWSTTSGTNTMTIKEAITHLPPVRPQLVAGQIHGSSAYVILIRLNGNKLFVEGPTGTDMGDLNTNYKLGTVYTVQITASGGMIQVSYNGSLKASFSNNTSGDYFKAGCYTQSNPSYGDSPNEYGQDIIYSLSVSHS